MNWRSTWDASAEPNRRFLMPLTGTAPLGVTW